MKSLGDLFLNHKLPGFKEAHIRHMVAEKITELLHVPVSPRAVSVKDGIVSLSVPPVVKSAILLKTEELKTLLQSVGVEVTTFK